MLFTRTFLPAALPQVDEEYKCAAIKTLGVIATNVAAMMPPGPPGGDRVGGDLGPVAERLLESKTQVQLRNGRQRTMGYLSKALEEAAQSANPPIHMRPLAESELRPPTPPPFVPASAQHR